MSVGDTFTIAETGFGSGLNFLCAWQHWQEHAPKGANLHFISVEKYPLKQQDIQQALALWPELDVFSQALLRHYPAVNARGFHKLVLADNVCLTLIYEDVLEGLQQLLPINTVGPCVAKLNYGWSESAGSERLVDAWFLDGFAPPKNPDMWSSELFELMARLSLKGTSFSTFTSADIVDHGLAAAGFDVKRAAGFNPEGEILTGMFEAVRLKEPKPKQRIKADPSWHLVDRSQASPKHVAIIGAGLAGCQTAFQLAQRGVKVTIIDRQQVSADASGNPMGILYSKLSQHQSPFTEFNLTAYLYACRFYETQDLFTSAGSQCGVLQLAETNAQAVKHQAIAALFKESPNLVRWLTKAEAKIKSGLTSNFGGLWFSQAGWLSPPQICKSLLQHPNITVIEHSPVDQLCLDEQQSERWNIIGRDNTTIATADAVVIACADSAKAFEQCQALPTKAIRGQISFLSTTQDSEPLQTVLCGHSYFAPQNKHRHCVGATFDLKSSSTELREQDHNTNLMNSRSLSPELETLTGPELAQGRVSFRCTTPDYLPIVGPIPKEKPMSGRFSAYRTNFKKVIDNIGDYHPGLYLNVGHGSKGLTYTPICADLLCSMILGGPLPLPRNLALYLHSTRFLMRDLARNRPST